MPGTSQTGGDICERRRAEIAGQIVSGELSIQEACAQNQLSPELLLEWVAVFRQASLTAFDEQVRRTLAEQGVDTSTLASAEFQGDLGQFTIADLIQTLTLGDRDGVITVSHEGRESRLWCAGGEIIDAESGRLSGIGAVHRMLALDQGRVRASFHRVQRARRVHASTMELLLDGARQSDECRVLRVRLGTGTYQTAPQLERLAKGSTAAEAALLRQFLAPCRVADALIESETSDLETLTSLARLVEQGTLLPVAGESSAPSAPAISSPPLVLSLARFPTQPATPRAHRRWALGLGLLALGLLILPLASRARTLPPRGAFAAGRSEARAQQAPEQAALPASQASDSPAEAGPEAEAAGEARVPRLATAPGPSAQNDAAPSTGPEPSSPGRARARARRRAASGTTAAAATGTPVAPADTITPPATSADSATGTSTPPRMRLIEARRPQMQILE